MKKVIICGIALLTMWSCENLTDSSGQLKSYLPLTIGNCWVYQHYRIDSTGLEKKLSMFDSIKITGDSVIKSRRYFKLSQSMPSVSTIPNLVRDSSGYLLDDKSNIYFSGTNFTDTLLRRDFVDNSINYYKTTLRMEKPTDLTTVPLGSYEVLNSKVSMQIFVVYKDGMFKTITGPKIPVFYNNSYYAPKVGMILDTYRYLSDPTTRYERRLIRCRIN